MKLDAEDFHETFFEPFQLPLCSDRRSRRLIRKPVYILALRGIKGFFRRFCLTSELAAVTRVGTLIVATIYLQLIQYIYMFLSFTVLQCSHQHCVQPVASDVEVVGYL